MDVDKELVQIEQGLVWLEKGEMGVDGCFDLQGRFEELRGLYRESPALLEPHLDRLRLLSTRFEDYKQAHMRELVDEYHRLNDVLRETKRAREYLRDLLIEAAANQDVQELTGREARVSISETRSPRLPRPGSAERDRLEDLIQEAGQWKAVSQLSAKMLTTVLAGDSFDAEAKQAIDPLMPHEPTWRVVSVGIPT